MSKQIIWHPGLEFGSPWSCPRLYRLSYLDSRFRTLMPNFLRMTRFSNKLHIQNHGIIRLMSKNKIVKKSDFFKFPYGYDRK